MTHYYNFEPSDVQGTLVRNLATNSFDGSLVNGATVTSVDGSYKVGQSALDLVSTGVYSTSPYFSITNGIMLGNSGLTFAVWFKTSSVGYWNRLFEFSNGADRQNIFISSSYGMSTGKIAYFARYGSNDVVYSDLTVSDGTWRHVVWTLSTDGVWKMYMNSQLISTDTNRQVPEYIFRTDAWIGKSAYSADAPFNGQIDEFRIYNTVLDENDVLALYTYAGPIAVTSGLNSGILAYWTFDESSGSRYDSISNLEITEQRGSVLSTSGVTGSGVQIGTGSLSAPYLKLPSAICDVGSGSKSISMWFKLTRNDIGYQWILMQGASHDASNYIPFYIEQSNQLSTVLTVTDYTWTGYIPYGIPTGNVWHHVVLTIGSGVVSGYLDGVLKGTTTYSGTIISMGDSHTLGFYRSGPGASSPTEVSTRAQIFIDELGIWNRVLSLSEVSSLYSNGNGIKMFKEGKVLLVPGTSALANCASLTSIIIPTSVSYIGSYALTMTGLQSLTIPTSVTYVGMKFLAGCNSLTSITAPASLSLTSSLTGCQQLIEDTSYSVVGMKRYTLQTMTSVTIAAGTVSVSVAQYYGCPISNTTIPTSVTSVGAYAFRFSSLSHVNIPSSTTKIDILAFESCSSLASVTIPTSVTFIGTLFSLFSFTFIL